MNEEEAKALAKAMEEADISGLSREAIRELEIAAHNLYQDSRVFRLGLESR